MFGASVLSEPCRTPAQTRGQFSGQKCSSSSLAQGEAPEHRIPTAWESDPNKRQAGRKRAYAATHATSPHVRAPRLSTGPAPAPRLPAADAAPIETLSSPFPAASPPPDPGFYLFLPPTTRAGAIW
jgi:hypothetical protein